MNVQPQITLLICTHNGARTIENALVAIDKQNDVSNDSLEVLIIDNVSTDNTAQIASDFLQKSNLNGRVLFEPRIGKTNAFLKGLKEAKSEIISIVDDDNYIEPDFIKYTLKIFNEYSDVGIVCSSNRIFTEQDLPYWFKWVSGRYSCSDPYFENIERSETDGTIISHNRFVTGAGSSFRSQILKDCLDKGYYFFNDAQRGKTMKVSCQDLEVSCLIYALGYSCGYHPSIKLIHAIQPERLNLEYFKIFAKTMGAGTLGMDPFMFTHKQDALSFSIRCTWQWQLLSKLKRYLKFAYTGALFYFKGVTEKQKFRNWLERTQCKGAILRILRERGNYTKHIRQVASGDWTKLRVR